MPPPFLRLCQSQRFGLATRGEPLADPYEGRIRSLMSPEITDRRGYELSDTYSGLQELWRGHYDHFNELLKQFLLQSYQETGDLLELLEVGAGTNRSCFVDLRKPTGRAPARRRSRSIW